MFEYRPFVDQFLDYCRYHKKLSDKTVRAYKIDLSQYVLFSDTLSKQALWDYIECLNKKYKPKTVKRKLATLKAFIHFLLLQDYIDFNPFDKLETSIREPVLLPKTIPLDVIAKIISFSYQQIGSAQSAYQMKCAVRNAAVIELLFATGARIAEICTLKPENVDLLGRSVKFYGKGSKERLIPVENMAVLSILKRYRLLFEDKIAVSGYFFVNKLGRRMTEQFVCDSAFGRGRGHSLHTKNVGSQLDNYDSDLHARYIIKAKGDLKDQAPKKQNGFSVICYNQLYYII